MMENGEKQQLMERINKCADQLAEHFESVLILCTRSTEDGNAHTAAFETGRGNFHAQLGHVYEWLTIQDQYQRNEAIRRETKE